MDEYRAHVEGRGCPFVHRAPLEPATGREGALGEAMSLSEVLP
jgi:hypothetical protein